MVFRDSHMKYFNFFSLALVLIYSAVVSALPSVSNDVFCDIISGNGPATIIYEDNDLIVIEKRKIKDSNGLLVFREPANCLIIPKKHIVNIKYLDQSNAYDAALLSKMVAVAQRLSQQLCSPAEFTITMNNGKTSYQTVFHMHMHFKSPQRWKNPDWRMKKIQLGSYKTRARDT